MVKKKRAVSKKNTKPKRVIEHKTVKDVRVEKILVENFVSLQKVMTNLSIKFDSLATQISKLLELFEISAKSLAEKNVESIKAQGETKEILKKMDSLLDQNKVIARGLTLVHEKMPESEIESEQITSDFLMPSTSFEQSSIEVPKKFEPPRPKNISPNSVNDVDFGEYQKSIADL